MVAEVAVVAYAQTPMYRDAGARNEVELLMDVVSRVKADLGIETRDIDFTCSGSCDYFQGMPFSFVEGVDALGAVPPIKESHVEMDAAWALYEAWLKIISGDAEVALVAGFSKSSPGNLQQILSLQMDPYYLAPLWPDAIGLAGMQARLMLESGAVSEERMAQTVAASRRAAQDNPNAYLKGEVSVEELLAQPMHSDPLRRHDCAPLSDGASAMIIAARSRAEKLVERPALIRGIDHRIESSHLGARDLSRSKSTEKAAAMAGAAKDKVDVAELYAPFSHQVTLLAEAIGLADGVEINPSGGPLAGNIMMAGGLDRIGEVTRRISDGSADRGVAHATSGPCLQQNMVVTLEGA